MDYDIPKLENIQVIKELEAKRVQNKIQLQVTQFIKEIRVELFKFI